MKLRTTELKDLVADALRRATERDDAENALRGASVVDTKFPSDSMFTVHDVDGRPWFDVKIVRVDGP